MHEDDLKNQLTIARNEINNLRYNKNTNPWSCWSSSSMLFMYLDYMCNIRQQVRNLQHVQRKDIETINRLLQDFRCEGCASNKNTKSKDNDKDKLESVLLEQVRFR